MSDHTKYSTQELMPRFLFLSDEISRLQRFLERDSNLPISTEKVALDLALGNHSNTKANGHDNSSNSESHSGVVGEGKKVVQDDDNGEAEAIVTGLPLVGNVLESEILLGDPEEDKNLSTSGTIYSFHRFIKCIYICYNM